MLIRLFVVSPLRGACLPACLGGMGWHGMAWHLQAGAGDDQEHPAVRTLPREVRKVALHLPHVRPGRLARGLLTAVRYPRRDLHAAVPG